MGQRRGGDQEAVWQRDLLGRVTGSKNSHLGQFGYGYLGDTGQLVSSILAGTQIEQGYGYEPNAGDRRLKEIRHPQAARSFAYTNAPSFLITAMAETSQGQSVAWDFTYDEINRLQTAKRGDGQHYQYSFDKGDNLLSIATPEGMRTFRPSLGNKLNQAHYQHDPVGNRAADDRHRYTWDAENRLVGISYKADPQKSTEFRYDGQSRRVAIIETDGIRKTETKYTWCGNVICQAKDAQDRPVAYYFSQGVYRPQAKGNKKEYYAKDYLGSIRDVLDEKGSPIARYDYDPYGNLTSDPAKAPEFGYAGMHYHALSGLYLTKYRAYDPQSGRWLSRDPIGEAGGINLYAYVGGNPVSFIDPLGLARVCKRPLAGMSSMPGVLRHDHIFYDDYHTYSDVNVGFTSGEGIFHEESKYGGMMTLDFLDKGYVCETAYFEDAKIAQAVQKLRDSGEWTGKSYNPATHNCQDFVSAVLMIYFELGGEVLDDRPLPAFDYMRLPPTIPPGFGLTP